MYCWCVTLMHKGRANATVLRLRSEADFWESFLFPSCWAQDQIQVVRLGNKWIYLLSHLTGPVWFWDRMPLISLGLLRSYCSVQNCLELPIFLPQSPECSDYRCVQHFPPRPGFDLHCASKLFIIVVDKPVKKLKRRKIYLASGFLEVSVHG